MEGNGGGINRVLDRKGRKECPSCGANDWVQPDDVSSAVIPYLDMQGQPVRGRGIDALVFLCGQCGFVRLHSRAVLRGDVDASG
jgi:ribosomal protein S27AE